MNKPPPPKVPYQPSTEEIKRKEEEYEIFMSKQPDLAKAKIKLLSVRKGWDKSLERNSATSYANRKWVLDSITILKLLPKAEATDFMGLDLGPWSFLPETMEGDVLINGVNYSYSINAGSHMYISPAGAHDGYRYCWYDKRSLKHFLDIPDFEQYKRDSDN